MFFQMIAHFGELVNDFGKNCEKFYDIIQSKSERGNFILRFFEGKFVKNRLLRSKFIK